MVSYKLSNPQREKGVFMGHMGRVKHWRTLTGMGEGL
jgi:hypothetical protein